MAQFRARASTFAHFVPGGNDKMLLQRIVYYFFVVLIFFLIFDKLGFVSFKIAGALSLYAAATLFASVNTIILFLLASLVYSQRLHSAQRFVADMLSVLVASITPVLLLAATASFSSAYLSLSGPLVPLLFKALSILVPAIWLGWLALAFFFFEIAEPNKVKAEKPAKREIIKEKPAAKQEVVVINQTTTAVTEPWKKLYDVALLRIEQGDFFAARPLLAECLALLERDQQTNQFDLFNVIHQYADCLLRLKEFALACSFYERALRLLNRLPNKDGFDDGTLFSTLVIGLEACHQGRYQGQNDASS